MERVVISSKKQKSRLEKIKQTSGYIALGISDVLNTLTPPGFEIYLATELLKTDNIEITIKFLQKTVLLEVRKALSMRFVRGIMREDGYKLPYNIVEDELFNNY